MASEANIWNPRTTLLLSSNTKRVEEKLTAIAGQTLFVLKDFAYAINTGALAVYQQDTDAVVTDKGAGLLAKGTDWAEQSTTSFSLVAPAKAGDIIVAVGYVAITANVDVRDTDIYVANYQAIRDYAGIEITLYAQGAITGGDRGEAFFHKITGAAPGFYVDDGQDTLVPIGGDGSIGWVRNSYRTTVADVAQFTNIAAVPGAVFDTVSYSDGWAASVDGPVGGGVYDTVTKAVHDVVRAISTVDELGDHTFSNGNVALLRQESGVRYAAQFGARDGIADSGGAIRGAIKSLLEGGTVYMPQGVLKSAAEIRDDILDPTKIGKTITLVGVGSTEDSVNSGKVTEILTAGAIVGIRFDGNRSGGRDFTISGDGGAFSSGADNIVVESSRAQWSNVVSRFARGDGLRFKFGNSSTFRSIGCLVNKGNGFNADGTDYVNKAGASKPNDLNACDFINIDARANTLVGFRTGVNSGFANNCHQVTVQSNGGVGMEFGGDFWNVYGFYGEANDSAGTNKDIRFTSTADVNRVHGQFSNVSPAWEDLSANQRNFIEQFRQSTLEIQLQTLQLGLDDATTPGNLKIDGKGDGTNTFVTLENTAGNHVTKVTSSGAGTYKWDFEDGIVLETSILPTLLNSWINFGGSRKVAGFFKDAFGVVHLEGVISSGTTTSPTVLFTLPVGYRPTARQLFVCNSNGALGTGFVEASGDVLFESGSNVSFSLDSISFRTD